MSIFDRTQLPHPVLPGDWGPTVRADESARAPALPDINPMNIALARVQQANLAFSGAVGAVGGGVAGGGSGAGGSVPGGVGEKPADGDTDATFRLIFMPLPFGIVTDVETVGSTVTVSAADLSPAWPYVLTVEFERQPTGGGDWTDFQPATAELVADLYGNASADIPVPSSPGYNVRIKTGSWVITP